MRSWRSTVNKCHKEHTYRCTMRNGMRNVCYRWYIYIYVSISALVWVDFPHSVDVWAGSDSTSLNLSVYLVCFMHMTIIIIKRVVILFVVYIWEWAKHHNKNRNGEKGIWRRITTTTATTIENCATICKQHVLTRLNNMRIWKSILPTNARIHAFMLSFYQLFWLCMEIIS